MRSNSISCLRGCGTRTVLGRRGGVAFACSAAVSGTDVETLPGGGEPSAVKSDFCSDSVFGSGTGVTAGLFMPMAFAVLGNCTCRVNNARSLSLNAHSPARPAASSGRPTLCVRGKH